MWFAAGISEEQCALHIATNFLIIPFCIGTAFILLASSHWLLLLARKGKGTALWARIPIAVMKAETEQYVVKWNWEIKNTGMLQNKVLCALHCSPQSVAVIILWPTAKINPLSQRCESRVWVHFLKLMKFSKRYLILQKTVINSSFKTFISFSCIMIYSAFCLYLQKLTFSQIWQKARECEIQQQDTAVDLVICVCEPKCGSVILQSIVQFINDCAHWTEKKYIFFSVTFLII
jgi:hypothetical protein